MAEHVRKPIQVSEPVHAELTRLAQEETARLGRAVTFSEVIERLIASWHAVDALMERS